MSKEEQMNWYIWSDVCFVSTGQLVVPETGHDLLLFLLDLPALEVEGRDGGGREHLDGAEQQHVRDAGGDPGRGAPAPPAERERVHGRHGGAERAGGHDVERGLRAAAPHEAPRAGHGGGAVAPRFGGGDRDGDGADDGEVDEEERGEEHEQRVEEEEQEGVVEERHGEHRQRHDGGGAGELEGVPEGDGQDGAPEVALCRAERHRGHGGAPLGGAGGREGGDGGKDGGDLDGGAGDDGAEEPAASGEEEAAEVGLEGPDEVPVRGGGRVGAADGVGVEEHGGGEGLHGERVPEEQRRGEGGREGEEREEERAVPGRDDRAVLEEGEEARRRLPRV
ncbi:unnamed protein product [Urochloa decumbens]|uniref:Uncharacterized protein n=1 Tax=Urochloa decumbens TaxID=240449 RepID=A0ABC9C075_9POAL